MTTTTDKKFKPQLLYKDESRIEGSLKNANQNAEKLNEALEVSTEFIGGDFTDEDKENILLGGFNKAMELIREKYQFPNADDDFNLKSMGKDPEPVKLALRSSNSLYRGFEYGILNGKVVLTGNGKKTIEEGACTYTKNDAQNSAFDLAKRVCKNLNEAMSYGFIDSSDQTPIAQGVKLAKYSTDTKNYVPNVNFLKNIDPFGGVRSSAY